jgi:hypothetical protein
VEVVEKQVLYPPCYPSLQEFRTVCEGFFRKAGQHQTELRRLSRENPAIVGN